MHRALLLLILLTVGVRGLAVPCTTSGGIRQSVPPDELACLNCAVTVDPLTDMTSLKFVSDSPYDDPVTYARRLEARAMLEEAAGRKEDARKKTEKAREVYEEVIKVNPNHFKARLQLLKLYEKARDADGAILVLSGLLAAHPDFAEGWLMGGNLISIVLSNPDQPWAMAILRAFVSRYEAFTRFSRDDEKLTTKLKKLKDIVERSGGGANLRQSGARPLVVDIGRIFYSKAMALEPGDFKVLRATAEFYWLLMNKVDYRLEYAEAALKACEAAVREYPNYYMAHALFGAASLHRARAEKADSRGTAPLREHFFDLAIDHYKKALFLSPPKHCPSYVSSIGTIYGESGRADEGIEYLRQLAAGSDAPAVQLAARQATADLLFLAGRSGEGEAEYRRIIKDYPDYLDAYILLLLNYMNAAKDPGPRLYARSIIQHVFGTSAPRSPEEQARWREMLRGIDRYSCGEEASDTITFDHGVAARIKAAALLTDAIRKHPDFLDAHVHLGSLYMDAGVFYLAERHFAEALRLPNRGYKTVTLDPNANTDQATLRYFHTAVMGLSSISSRRGEFLKAGDIIAHHSKMYFETEPDGSIRLDEDGYPVVREPKNLAAEALLAAGEAYMKSSDQDAAAVSLRKAIAVKKGDFPKAQKLLARLHIAVVRSDASVEQKREAISAARRILEELTTNHPEDLDAQLNLAHVMFLTTRHSREQTNRIHNGQSYNTDADLAVKVLSDVLKRQPDLAPALILRARIYEFLGNTERALKDANYVLSLTPANARMLAGGRPVAAPGPWLEYYFDEARSLIAWIYAEHEPALDEAERLANEVLEHRPNAPELLDTLAWVCYRRAAEETDPEKKAELLAAAAQYISAALRQRTDSTTLYHAAEIAAAADPRPKALDKAISRLDKALKQDPTFPEARRAERLRSILRERLTP